MNALPTNSDTMASSKTILIDIPCPISMRNTLTGPHSVYRRLKALGYHVIITAPASAAAEIRATYGAEVIPVKLDKSTTKREQVSDFITRHLNLTRMQILGSKYGLRHNLDKKTRHQHLHILRIIISKTLGKWRWFRLIIAPRLHLWAYRRRQLKSLLEEVKPNLVFLPNPGSPQSEETLRECKRLGIKTVGMVGSWDHPHKKFHVLHTDSLFVWSDSIKAEAINLQTYQATDVKVVGAPHSDLFYDKSFILPREQFFGEMGLDPKRKLVTLFSGTGRAPDEGDIVDMVLNWSDDGKTRAPLAVHIRAYPGDSDDHQKFDQFAGRDHLYTDWIDYGKAFGPAPLNYFPDEYYMKRVVSLFYHSETILSVYSSASVEASMFLKPAINVAFDGYKDRPFAESVKRFVYQSHYDKLFATGAVLNTQSQAELLAAINQVLTEPHCNQANIKQLQTVVCGPLDGQVAKRMVEHIVNQLVK